MRGKELGEFDSVKKVSMLIDINGGRQELPLLFGNLRVPPALNHPPSEHPIGGAEGEGGNDQQRPDSGEQAGDTEVFEEYAFDNHDEVPQRIEPIEVLKP